MLEAHVFPAYAHLIETLSSLKGSGANPYGLAHYPEGRSYYQALTDAIIGSDRTLSEIRDLIDHQLLSDVRQMAELVKNRPELLTDVPRTTTAREPEQILAELQARCWLIFLLPTQMLILARIPTVPPPPFPFPSSLSPRPCRNIRALPST